MEQNEKQYAPDMTEEEKEEAVQCECCKVYENFELMRDMPSGVYCIDCWDDIYG